MNGRKISELPAIVSPALTDIFPVVQSGVTYKETINQLSTLLFTSPIFVSPVLGAATATTLTFSPTTGGIVGTTTNNNANAGLVGEFISSLVLASAPAAFASGVVRNVTSISLTAGDWDVWGNINFVYSAGSSLLAGWISSTSAVFPDAALTNYVQPTVGTLFFNYGMCVPSLRFSLSGTTTIYLSAQPGIFAGTADGSGGLYARRVR